MTKVILVTGLKRSGKDYVSDIIKGELEAIGKSVETIAFADAMKDILCVTFGISLGTLNELKNDESHHIELTDDDSFTMRSCLQRFGTDAMQSVFGSTVWKNLVEEFIQKSEADVVIVTDYRFQSEYINGSVVVKINNTNVETGKNSHISEIGICDNLCEHIVENTGYPSDDVIRASITELIAFYSHV